MQNSTIIQDNITFANIIVELKDNYSINNIEEWLEAQDEGTIDNIDLLQAFVDEDQIFDTLDKIELYFTIK